MTYEEAEKLQSSAERVEVADLGLRVRTWVGEGEDPQLIERAEEYLAARKAHADLLERLET